jgi:signal transduction histidine kinase
MPRLHLSRIVPSLPALNSLRVQLILWIALPVAVSLLGMSLVEIRGHEQAMTQLVQQQADLVARSLSVLLEAHIDQRAAVLEQVAAEYIAGSEHITAPESVFAAGVFIRESPSTSTGAQRPPWLNSEAVVALTDEVHATQLPGLTTVYDAAQQTWLLVQAVPIAARGSSPASTLVGAEPVAALVTEHTIASLDPVLIDEMRLTSASGDLLYSQASEHAFATLGQVAPEHEGHGPARWVTGNAIVLSTGWQVTIRKDWRALVPPVLSFGNAALVIVGIAVVLSLLSAYFGLRNIVWPLKRLDQAAGQVGWGNFTAIYRPVGGVAEIEELRRALARMTDQVRQYQLELQSYIGAMTVGQEEERRRLARELHDETVQDLIALNQRLEMVERELTRDPQRAAARLRELRPLVTGTINALRRQIQALRPLYLEDLGFVPAIEMLVHESTKQSLLTARFTVTEDVPVHVTPALQISVYRIVQEALQNVIKHAAAGEVHVDLHIAANDLTLCVTDNGRGFVVPSHPYYLGQRGHFGLLGMKERAQLHGGTFEIKSQLNQGTAIRVELPLYELSKPHRVITAPSLS